jgi:hypothetical protein
MIAKINTSVGGTNKGSNTLLWIAVLAIGGFVVYKYVLQPKQTDRENQ